MHLFLYILLKKFFLATSTWWQYQRKYEHVVEVYVPVSASSKYKSEW